MTRSKTYLTEVLLRVRGTIIQTIILLCKPWLEHLVHHYVRLNTQRVLLGQQRIAFESASNFTPIVNGPARDFRRAIQLEKWHFASSLFEEIMKYQTFP